MGLVANRLKADKNAILDNRKLPRLDPVVIVATGRKTLGPGPIAEDVDDLGSDAEFPEFVGGQKTGAGVVGLVAQGPVQLGRVADRLVDRQAQVGWEQDQILDARRNRR